MRMRTKKNLLNLLLGAGVLLLDPLRDRFGDNFDDLKDRAQDLRDKARDRYDVASDRVSRAADVIRGEDHSVLSQTFAFVAGVGIGVGVGLLLAPASGEETRSNLADKVHDFGSQVRDRFSSESRTGTGS
jgi:ElaB/YqjD/DUF883 family membrane-anchored ribosome-binding protein